MTDNEKLAREIREDGCIVCGRPIHGDEIYCGVLCEVRDEEQTLDDRESEH